MHLPHSCPPTHLIANGSYQETQRTFKDDDFDIDFDKRMWKHWTLNSYIKRAWAKSDGDTCMEVFALRFLEVLSIFQNSNVRIKVRPSTPPESLTKVFQFIYVGHEFPSTKPPRSFIFDGDELMVVQLEPGSLPETVRGNKRGRSGRSD